MPWVILSSTPSEIDPSDFGALTIKLVTINGTSNFPYNLVLKQTMKSIFLDFFRRIHQIYSPGVVYMSPEYALTRLSQLKKMKLGCEDNPTDHPRFLGGDIAFTSGL